MSALAGKPGVRLPSADERAAANQLRRILAAQAAGDRDRTLRVTSETGERAEVILTPALSTLLLDLLRHIGQGDAVAVVPVSRMLTTQQAADILNVSRPFLISLIEKGAIRHVLVGRHRRIEAEELFRYKQERDRQRAEALAELAETDAGLI